MTKTCQTAKVKFFQPSLFKMPNLTYISTLNWLQIAGQRRAVGGTALYIGNN